LAFSRIPEGLIHSAEVLGMFSHQLSLPVDGDQGSNEREGLQTPNQYQPCCEVSYFPLYLYVFVALVFIGLGAYGGCLICNRRSWSGGLLLTLGLCGFLSLSTIALCCDPFFWRAEWIGLSGGDPYRCQYNDQSYSAHDLKTVAQKLMDLRPALVGGLRAWISSPISTPSGSTGGR
jgi:hypothetical protein